MRPPPQTRTKREEVKTYQQLGLNRSMKSRALRARMEKSGVHRVVGGQEMDRPYLQASKQRYYEIKREVTRELLERARASNLQIPVNHLLQHLQVRIDQLTYDRIAAERQQLTRLESSFLQHHGRSPTIHEKACFAACAAPKEAAIRAEQRHSMIDGLLNKMQERQIHNPARYQTIWAEVVGTEIAQQSNLEKINTVEGVAYFRCLNSALSYQLQRQTELPKKLSRALGVPIRQIRASR